MITRKDKLDQLRKEIKLLDESIEISDNGKGQYLREKAIFTSILKDYRKQTLLEYILVIVGIIIAILLILRAFSIF